MFNNKLAEGLPDARFFFEDLVILVVREVEFVFGYHVIKPKTLSGSRDHVLGQKMWVRARVGIRWGGRTDLFW